MVDAVLGAGLIEEGSASWLALASGAEVIGQLCFMVCQQGRDAKPILGVGAFQGSGVRCFVRLNLAEGLVLQLICQFSLVETLVAGPVIISSGRRAMGVKRCRVGAAILILTNFHQPVGAVKQEL